MTESRHPDPLQPPFEGFSSVPAASMAPDGVDVQLVAEEVRGPVMGLYIAAYTVFTSRGFFSYAKVTWTDPPSYWDVGDVLFKLALGPRSNGAEAHEGIFRAVESRLGRRTAFQPTVPGEA